jgi:phosphoserine phosphatase RsbU/P
MAAMSSPHYTPVPGRQSRPGGWGRGVHGFWRQVSDGLKVQELWGQFKADARAGYGWYSKEIDWQTIEGERPIHRYWRAVKAVFWAMLMKLSPPRRVVLVVSLALLILSFLAVQVEVSDHNTVVMPQGRGEAILAAMGLLLLLALELADRVAMKRDLEIAKEIQHWLVPEKPPEIPGVEIAFASRAANTVAGDYYDAFVREQRSQVDPSAAANGSGQRLMVVVADVAGKSVPAALLMASFQASLRTLALGPDSLLELVAGMNAYSCQHSQGGRRFTTAFFAEYELEKRRLSYVNAGHNQPIVLRAAGGLDRLSAGGLPLGIMRDAKYESGEVFLDAGDRLVIFTDGAVEAENQNSDEFGEGRLLSELQMRRASRAGDALQRIMTAIDAFVGRAPQHDDITCLILDFQKDGPRASIEA